MPCPLYVRLSWLKMIKNDSNLQKAKHCVNSRYDDSHAFKNLIRKLETAVLQALKNSLWIVLLLYLFQDRKARAASIVLEDFLAALCIVQVRERDVQPYFFSCRIYVCDERSSKLVDCCIIGGVFPVNVDQDGYALVSIMRLLTWKGRGPTYKRAHGRIEVNSISTSVLRRLKLSFGDGLEGQGRTTSSNVLQSLDYGLRIQFIQKGYGILADFDRCRGKKPAKDQVRRSKIGGSMLGC